MRAEPRHIHGWRLAITFGWKRMFQLDVVTEYPPQSLDSSDQAFAARKPMK